MSDFKAKMHQIDFGWGSGPDPAGEAYSATALNAFKNSAFKMHLWNQWKRNTVGPVGTTICSISQRRITRGFAGCSKTHEVHELVFLAVHDTRKISLSEFISNASNLSSSDLFMVQLSQPQRPQAAVVSVPWCL